MNIEENGSSKNKVNIVQKIMQASEKRIMHD